MRIRNFAIAASLMCLSPVAAAPVLAQARATITAGMEVRGPNDSLVGTVKTVNGDFVIVATDRHEASLPKASFTPHEGKLLFGMTRDQLNAEVDKAQAAASAALIPGAVVQGAAGVQVGTIDAIDDTGVTLKLQSGKLVKLPRNGIGVGPSGPVIGMTAAELEAVVS